MPLKKKQLAEELLKELLGVEEPLGEVRRLIRPLEPKPDRRMVETIQRLLPKLTLGRQGTECRWKQTGWV